MAVETKIGLVVGLGFIVCFALILSHRGQADQLGSRMAQDVLNKYAAEPEAPSTSPPERYRREHVGGDATPASGGRAVPASAPGADTGTTMTVASRSSAPAESDRSMGTDRSSANGQDVVASPSAQKLSAGAPPDAAGSTGTSPKSEGRRTLRRAPSWEELFGSSEKASPSPGSPPANSPPEPGRSADPAPPPDASGESTRYVVQPKDTLWSIVQKNYGERSSKMVDEVFEANRSLLKTPNDIRVGMELLMPKADPPVSVQKADASRTPLKKAPKQASGESSAPGGSEPVKREEKRPTKPGGTRYYQVKEGDRYATIAERFLGNRSRWKEIHELNKDVFPDPSKITHGVRIRIPPSVLASTR